MKLLDRITGSAVFAIQLLILFLVLVETYVEIPPLLQPLGRLHPMILHMPIGFLLMLGLLEVFRKEFEGPSYDKIRRLCLLISALSTSIAALFGFFLSREGGYGADAIALHKWTGIGLSFLTYALLLIDNRKGLSGLYGKIGLAASIGLLLFTGHFGANLTHGENYIWAPLIQDEKPEPADQTLFAHAIFPILEQKCISCHNKRKSKGKLIMETLADIEKGGEHGKIWAAGNPSESSLIQRLLLPIEEEEHMPPEGKPQLSQTEIDLLSAWIKAGADTQIKWVDLPETDSLAQLVAQIYPPQQTKKAYNFPPAAPKTLESLNSPFVSVKELTSGSPALAADFFVRAGYDPQKLLDLLKVKEQLISLNLIGMPIADDDMSVIAQFPQLEILYLNETQITGATLHELAACQNLRTLAVSDTRISTGIDSLSKALPNLRELFMWNTDLSPEEIEGFTTKYPHIAFQTGFIPDEDELLKLSPPLLVNEETVIEQAEKIVLKQTFPGSQIRYTLDGSEPDSLASSLYQVPLEADGFTILKAKTFKENWLSSDLVSFTFFKRGVQPDSVRLLREPNKAYPGKGAMTLIDGEKGETDVFRSPKWLGYKDKPFEAVFYFQDSIPTISSLTFSYNKNIGSYIMPPLYVEVWGGDSPNSLKKLNRVAGNMPQTLERNEVSGVKIPIPASKYACFKVKAQAVRVLPSWHRGAGDKGWVFVDEIFFN